MEWIKQTDTINGAEYVEMIAHTDRHEVSTYAVYDHNDKPTGFVRLRVVTSEKSDDVLSILVPADADGNACLTAMRKAEEFIKLFDL